MNVSSSVVDMAILKSTGPELEKIEATLRDFGPRYRYLVTGYPPFLKTLGRPCGRGLGALRDLRRRRR
jgi:phenylacetate-CoA ligase